MAGRRKFVIDNPLPGYRLSFIFVKDFFSAGNAKISNLFKAAVACLVGSHLLIIVNQLLRSVRNRYFYYDVPNRKVFYV